LEIGRSHRVPNHQWWPCTRRLLRRRRADKFQCRRRRCFATGHVHDFK
jgi:hypothetical protein